MRGPSPRSSVYFNSFYPHAPIFPRRSHFLSFFLSLPLPVPRSLVNARSVDNINFSYETHFVASFRTSLTALRTFFGSLAVANMRLVRRSNSDFNSSTLPDSSFSSRLPPAPPACGFGARPASCASPLLPPAWGFAAPPRPFISPLNCKWHAVIQLMCLDNVSDAPN
ncbi:hypothetical protein, unlikely [Trypanosoma brucei gambiense DAL972]|uniref:Uncharacterized protein n=1 Tax=Trypanosoma brucei gambiense (strain MHOM/CI/86/DAL972) TaxID=679716 RepID=C9ZT86_TRYB9|nr:hypothetical protein, unlikely [Trypanosoma brucei gambiense DAL972]CBH12621.1 hypothetical protein, unlikely [Trypanosoma brucei gambiense DAL972]|eukprot:XP_011774901.1 hypothetical protein, unlikely [Trypanosoma brucei gambiense DAL972]